jgi:hypothetical protein
MGYMAVKVVQHEGDWFIIPAGPLEDKFQDLIERFEGDSNDTMYLDEIEFEETFRRYETGGDLNNIQLYKEV